MDDYILTRRRSFGSSLNHPNARGQGMRDGPLECLLASEQALLCGRVKRVSQECTSEW